MGTDGNTDAINQNLDEREVYDEQQELLQELQDLRDEVDTLTEKLAEVRSERDARDKEILNRIIRETRATARAEAAEAALVTARRDALEEAAQVCGHWMMTKTSATVETILDAEADIRALPTPTIEQLKEMMEENGDEATDCTDA